MCDNLRIYMAVARCREGSPCPTPTQYISPICQAHYVLLISAVIDGGERPVTLWLWFVYTLLPPIALLIREDQ